VARAETGETGRVIGVDMTENMISKARKNAKKLGYSNKEIKLDEELFINFLSGEEVAEF